MTSSRRRHQHDYRLIDVCFHKNLEIHVSRSFFEQMKLVFKKTEAPVFRGCTVITLQISA